MKVFSLIRRQAPPYREPPNTAPCVALFGEPLSPIGEGSSATLSERVAPKGALRAFLCCSPIIFPRAGRTELYGGETRFGAGQFRTDEKKPPRGFWRTQSARGKSEALHFIFTVGKLLRGFPGTLFSKSAPGSHSPVVLPKDAPGSYSVPSKSAPGSNLVTRKAPQ